MKVGVLSLGCPKNLVDSEVMLGLLERAGHEITADAHDAEALIVNTCAFIDSAKEESIDTILEMARHKHGGRCRRLVVTGCLAERYREQLRAQLPEIDAVLGTGEIPGIVDAVNHGSHDATAPLTFFSGERREGFRVPRFRVPGSERVRGSGNEAPVQPNPEPGTSNPARGTRHPAPDYLYDFDTPRHLTTPRHLAYVKVAEGCDYACSFCIIPTLRGHYRSRPADSIVREAEALAAGGVRELILISQDTTYYGVDRGERGALARLLRRLDAVEGLTWIRLLYLYPTTITDGVLDAMAECTKVCRYVDLPLQHASASVLRRMRRPGTRRSYERLLDRIRRRVPGVALRSTFIVGFPGETAADFAELESFVGDVGFDHLGVFTYSHEESTAAYALGDTVSSRVKRARRDRLMARQQRLVARRLRRRIGEVVRVLVDGSSPEHPLVAHGRLEGQAPEIDSLVYLTDCEPTAYAPGALVDAAVVDARGYDLAARPLA